MGEKEITTNENLKIEYIGVNELKPYNKNARKHSAEDVQYIVNSIEEFGMCDPIGIWGKNNLVVEGHGRLLALKKLGYATAPCIRLDHLSDEQRRAYALAHNRTAEMSEWDGDLLAQEREDLIDFDFTDFGFNDLEEKLEKDLSDAYSLNTNIPQYEVSGKKVSVDDLCDSDKTEELIEKIEASKISRQEKDFLIKAAGRHTVFNYKNIAEYYANASYDMQELMEESALVIIDIDDAIANGYCTLVEEIENLREEEDFDD